MTDLGLPIWHAPSISSAYLGKLPRSIMKAVIKFCNDHICSDKVSAAPDLHEDKPIDLE